MRLSGGARARQMLVAPKGRKTRPTGAKVREALYDILGDRVDGARVLDLFAGSGALGFEAMSRGARSVVFVEFDASAVMVIRRNAVRVIGDTERFRIMPMRVSRALRTLRGTFDIVIMDPPYRRGAAEELKLLMQRSLLAPDAVVVVEHAADDAVALPPSLQAVKFAKYGDSALTFAMAPRRPAARRDEPGDDEALEDAAAAASARPQKMGLAKPRGRAKSGRTRR